MVNLDPNIGSTPLKINPESFSASKTTADESGKSGFETAVKTISGYISKVDDLQAASDTSIKDLLAGKNSEITSVVSAMAKADISFKLLVGVRNKLIEAYKQTMNMPL